MKYRNSTFTFVTDSGNEYCVHFTWTPPPKKYSRGNQTVIFSKNGKVIGHLETVRGNHNKTNALHFLNEFLKEN